MSFQRRASAFDLGRRMDARFMATAQAGGAPLTLPTTDLLDAWDARTGITITGSGVSSWLGLHAGTNAVQSTDAKRPTLVASGINGKPSVRFVKANGDWLLVSSLTSAPTNMTIYFVMSTTTPASQQILLDSQTGRLYIESGTASVRVFDGANRTVLGSALNSTALMCVVLNGAASTTTGYLNGVAGSTSALTPRSLGGQFGIGAAYAGGSSADMGLSALLIYTAAHDATARAAVQAYCTQEWGVP